MYPPTSAAQIIFTLDPVTLRPCELRIVLAKLADPIELKDDHESRNRNVRKITPPVDDDFELSHNFEGTHRLEDPQ